MCLKVTRVKVTRCTGISNVKFGRRAEVWALYMRAAPLTSGGPFSITPHSQADTWEFNQDGGEGLSFSSGSLSMCPEFHYSMQPGSQRRYLKKEGQVQAMLPFINSASEVVQAHFHLILLYGTVIMAYPRRCESSLLINM